MAHTKKVMLPGSPVKEKEEDDPVHIPTGKFQPSFGFDEHLKKKPRSSLTEAYEFWHANQTPANMQAALAAAKPVIGKAITSYAGGDKALTGRAKRLAIDAFRNYDPTRGTKLNTHLMIRLQPLQRSFSKRVTPLAVPERVQLDQYRLRLAEEEIKQTRNREGADSELSEMTGMTARRIAHVRKFSKGTLSEGQMTTPEAGVNLPGSEGLSPEDIYVEYVHHDLDPIDKKIMEWKTGMYGKERLGTTQIARKLGITPSAVSQRAAKIARKLEEGKDHGPSD